MSALAVPKRRSATRVRPKPGHRPRRVAAIRIPENAAPNPLPPVSSAPATTIQPKLEVGEPNDRFELEADRIADEVMRMPEPRASGQVPATASAPPTRIERVCRDCEEESSSRPVTLQRMCPECEEEETIQAEEASRRKPEVTPDIQTRIDGLRGRGQPLPASARAFFEPRFGQNFSSVRVHTDARAADAARAVNARAFTVGRDVVFGAGAYAPQAMTGRRLLAHELAHVVQQRPADTRSLQRLTEAERAENLKSPKYAGTRRLERAFDNEPSLGVGESGEAVRLVQEGLVADGFELPRSTKSTGELDGGFGEETFTVIKEFQSKHGLDVDGVVGRQTMGKLDELALKGPPPTITPGKRTIPQGAVPPRSLHMSGTFGFTARARDPSLDVPEIFLGPTLGEELEGVQRGGINFKASVSGDPATRGWVFYVQNLRDYVVEVRLRRDDLQKDCEDRLESTALDSGYPYDGRGIRFRGSFLTLGFLATVDSPSVLGLAEETFQQGDEMNLFTSQCFRMFLAWDPREAPEPPSADGAQLISLGFVDWGWTSSGTFDADSTPEGIVWHLRAMASAVFGGGSMQATDVPIVLDPLITGDVLGTRLRDKCASGQLKA